MSLGDTIRLVGALHKSIEAMFHYRVQGIPGAAFVVRRGFPAKDRCVGDSWDSIIPEVSRAIPISDDALHKHNVQL